MTLYHFTTSAHLPRIIRSGKLRVPNYTSRNGIRDFIWATADPNGERTAAGAIGTWAREYRNGALARVRLTLDGGGFEPWREVVARYPGWTSKIIADYEESARRSKQSTTEWYCRPGDLPLANVRAADTRTYLGHRWIPFDLERVVIESVSGGPLDADCLGIEIGGKLFWSERQTMPDGHHVYQLGIPMAA